MSLEQIETSIEKLYIAKEQYFILHESASTEDRNVFVEDEVTGLLKNMDENADSLQSENRARYLYLRGRLLNVRSEFDQTAFDALMKSVKLCPKFAHAWNELGECYWKQGDVKNAQNCFESALKHVIDKVALRNLSMVLRQCTGTPEEQSKSLYDSLQKAKQALQLDLNDGKSWYILGNANLTLFFRSNQLTFLRQALSSYTRALEDESQKCNPDLYYNRAMALTYTEDYSLALDCFKKASKFDPPWEQPRQKFDNLEKFLRAIHHMVETKGQQKPRKIQALLSSLKSQHSGSWKNKQVVSFSELKLGSNEGRVIVCKAIAGAPPCNQIPFTFCAVDATGETCFSVNVYNVAAGKGVVMGDSVAIPDPQYSIVEVTLSDGTVCVPL